MAKKETSYGETEATGYFTCSTTVHCASGSPLA